MRLCHLLLGLNTADVCTLVLLSAIVKRHLMYSRHKAPVAGERIRIPIEALGFESLDLAHKRFVFSAKSSSLVAVLKVRP